MRKKFYGHNLFVLSKKNVERKPYFALIPSVLLTVKL